MQRKYILGLLLVFGIYSMSGCSNSADVKELGAVASYTLAPQTPEQSVTPVATEVPDEVPCTFTDKDLKAMKKFLESKTYVSFKQIMTNGSDSDGVLSEKIYSMQADLKSTVTYCNLDGEEYADNDKKNSHYHRDEKTGRWVEDSGKVRVVDWDILGYASALDIVDYLQAGDLLKAGSEGSKGEYAIYEFTTDATDEDLVGVDYDSLGEKSVCFLMRNNYEPVSYVTRVDFTVGGKSYYCTSTIQYEDFSNAGLKMPELGGKKNEAKK